METGRLVAMSGVPKIDPFANTPPERHWIEIRWLYCYLLYQATQALGPFGTNVIKVGLLAMAFAFSAASGPRRPLTAGLALPLAIAILAAAGRYFLRPELITYALFAAYLLLIQRYRRSGNQAVWVIPFLQVFWTNCHPLFPLGLALVGLYVASEMLSLIINRPRTGEEHKKVYGRLALGIALLIATAIACCVNPYGISGLAHSWQLYREIRGTVFKDYIAELTGIHAYPHSFLSVICFDALVVLCGLSAAANLRRLDWFLALTCAVTSYLTILSIRNLPLFCLSATPVIGDNFERSALFGRMAGTRFPATLSRLTLLFVLVLATYYSWQFATNRAYLGMTGGIQFGSGIAVNEYPIAAERFLRERQLPTPLFNTLSEGGYLLAHGHKVFIDPRLEVYGEKFFERYIRMVQSAGELDRAVGEFGFATMIVDIHSRVVNHLAGSKQWRLVSFDERAAVFVRADRLGNLHAIETSDDFARELEHVRRFVRTPPAYATLPLLSRAESPMPLLRLADFLRVFGQPALAKPLMEDAVRAYPDTPGVRESLDRLNQVLRISK
jgi:hypothetical protein